MNRNKMSSNKAKIFYSINTRHWPMLPPKWWISKLIHLPKSVIYCDLNHYYSYSKIKIDVHSWFDIFVKRNWVVTRWQQYRTHLHTNNT